MVIKINSRKIQALNDNLDKSEKQIGQEHKEN